jgi:hypothetical protein
MTASTFLRRARWLAFRVGESFHGVFLKYAQEHREEQTTDITDQRRPLKLTLLALNAPSMVCRGRCLGRQAADGRKGRWLTT